MRSKVKVREELEVALADCRAVLAWGKIGRRVQIQWRDYSLSKGYRFAVYPSQRSALEAVYRRLGQPAKVG